MGFRIHRGIFQKLNAGRTAYENTFKIDTDGRIKEVDAEGNVTAGYLKVGEQATDADTVDGLHSGSFLRSDADDTASGNITFSGTMYFTDASNHNRLNKGASFVNPKDPWSNFHMRAGQGEMYIDSSAYHIRPQDGSSDWIFINQDGLRLKSGWLRVDRSQGIYFQSYGGGWRMTDSSWIRAYNDKNIYTGGNIEVGGTIRSNGNGFYVDSTNVINSAGKFVQTVDNGTTQSNYFIQKAHGEPRNNLGSPTVTEMALFNEQFNNKTKFCDPSRVSIWSQDTQDAEWRDITSNYTQEHIRRFIAGYDSSSNIYIPNGVYKFRIEVTAVSYVSLQALYMYWSSNSHSTKLHVWARRVSDQVWLQVSNSNTNISAWPGHIYLPFNGIWFLPGPHSSTGHRDIVRFEFTPNWSGHATYGDRNIDLYKMQIWGGYPSGSRFPYSVNEYGDITAQRNLLGTTLYEGGTQLSSKYLGISAKAADANLLDGINSTSFLRSDAADTASSKITFTAAESVELSGIRGRAVGSQTGNFIHLFERVNIGYPNGWGGQAAPSYGLSTHGGAQFNVGGVSNAPFTFNGNTIWHAGNDGASSGLDADSVDGYHASRLLRIDGASQSGPNFTSLIPSSNESYFKEVHQIETGVDYPSGAYTYGFVQSTKMSAMKFQWYVPHTASRGSNNTQDTIYFRTGWGADQIYGWKYLIHSGNIAGQSVNYATTAGSANAVTWANVSGKPSTFAPSSHTHGIGGINDAPRWWNNFGDNHTTRTSFDAEGSSLTTGFGWRYIQGNGNGPGTSTSPNQYYGVTVGLGNDYNYDNYGMQLVIPRNTSTPYISVRFEESRSLGAWQKISAGYADSAGAVAWGNVTGKPSTFAPSSHTHSYNDLTNLPTIPTNNNQLTNGAGYITGSGNTSGYAGQLSDRGGYGNNSFSFNQESGTFAGYTGWANYFIGNHGDGSSYYNTVHIMPFWGVPQYSRLEGGTFRGPWTYWTTENMSQATVNTWNTAYGWGNHATQGYLTSVPSEYLTTTDNDGRYIRKDGGGVITKNATDIGASAYHLELYSADTSDATKQVSIRFHQGGRYWGQIRYNNDGFRFTEGSTNNLVTVKGRFVGDLVGQASTAGSVDWNNVDNKPSTFTPSNHAASKVTSGTFANARISQSSVTQHQGALSIAASQVTGLPAQNPPVTTSATGREPSTLTNIDFNTDDLVATFTLADGSTYTLQMLRPR